MKIALIHYRLVISGGLERRLIAYATYLANQGHEVHIVAGKQSKDVALPSNVRVHVLSPGLVPRPYRRRYFDVRVGRFMTQNRFDLSLSMMRTSHQDLVLCPGTHLGYLRALGRTPDTLGDREQIRADHAAFQRSSTVLAASGQIREELTSLYGVDPQRIEVLYPPVDTEVFRPALKSRQRELRKKLGLPADKRLFLFSSSSHELKGLSLLLDVFANVDATDALLVVAGAPTGAALDAVVDVGFRKNIEEFYAAADFTIHPSKYEAFGQIVSESLCCATPVLISDRVGAREVVADGEGRVLKADDHGAWRDLVETAEVSDFRIEPGFAERNQLTMPGHMEEILRLAPRAS